MTPPRAYPTAVTRTSVKRVLPTSELLRKLGDQFLKFGLRPRARGAGTHVSLRAEGECELRNVIAVGSIQNDENVVGARGDVDLLDLEPQFPRQLLGGLRPLGSVLHRTDALVGPVERQYERRHVLLPCSIRRFDEAADGQRASPGQGQQDIATPCEMHARSAVSLKLKTKRALPPHSIGGMVRTQATIASTSLSVILLK